MLAEFSLLLQQFLAGTQQITILLQLRLGYADERQQTIGVELHQLRRINAIGLDLFAAGAGNARWRPHTGSLFQRGLVASYSQYRRLHNTR